MQTSQRLCWESEVAQFKIESFCRRGFTSTFFLSFKIYWQSKNSCQKTWRTHTLYTSRQEIFYAFVNLLRINCFIFIFLNIFVCKHCTQIRFNKFFDNNIFNKFIYRIDCKSKSDKTAKCF